jgi:hypothetical protein
MLVTRTNSMAEVTVRIHQTLRSTPTMKAGASDHKWSIEEMVDLLPELRYNTRLQKSA